MPKLIRDTRDKYQKALDCMFGFRPRLDPRLTESQAREYPTDEQLPSLTELLTHIQEEATTGQAVHMLSNSANKALAQFFWERDPQNWRQFIKVRPAKGFKAQERILFGGIAGIQKRSEANAYPDLHFPPEFKSTFTPETRGGTVSLTREMLKNDDLDVLRNLPREISDGANETLSRFAYSLPTGNAGGSGLNTDTIYTGNTLYHAAHGNLATGALDITSLLARRAAIKKQWIPGQETLIDDASGIDDTVTTIGLLSTAGFFPGAIFKVGDELIKVGDVDPGNGVTGCTRGLYGTTPASHADEAAVQLQARPVKFKSLTILVPDALESTAYEILASEKVPGSNNNNRNFLNREHTERKIEVVAAHPCYLGDDENNWYLIADYESAPCFEIGFVDGVEEPQLIVQDAPAVGRVFDVDRITYKVRHEYSGTQVDYRGTQGSLVA
jgi:hypothetical protein